MSAAGASRATDFLLLRIIAYQARLAAAFFNETGPARVRYPDLYGAEAACPQAGSMLLDAV